jgi:hypothetical protein
MNNLQDPPEPPLSKEEGHQLLEPYFDDFWSIVESVWRAWEGIAEEGRMMISPTARANVLFSYIVHYARSLFSEVNDAKIYEGRLFLVGFGDALLRWKKLRGHDDLRSRNYPTLFQQEYSKQKRLPGIPRSTRLTVGYVLNPTATAIEALYITCPVGNKIVWFIEIPRPTKIKVLPLPTPQELTPVVRPVNVRRKESKDQKK